MPPNTQLERSVQPRTGRGRLVGWGGSPRRERWPGGGRAHRAEKTSSSTRPYRAGAHTLQIERAAMCGEGGQRAAPPCREEGATQPVSLGATGSRLGGRFLGPEIFFLYPNLVWKTMQSWQANHQNI